ncbi:hypothetical protein H6P81_010085 [Aristolochia fimbriata]|uniref:Uncharacterized protein n=1 Tax=Aristolochia fimbriata TaxID=158543 RepID=A0AAV7EMS2_ARIFI|nr:hypothetical protein H6P81_010085 [Aristolochia fimbriata]
MSRWRDKGSVGPKRGTTSSGRSLAGQPVRRPGYVLAGQQPGRSRRAESSSGRSASSLGPAGRTARVGLVGRTAAQARVRLAQLARPGLGPLGRTASSGRVRLAGQQFARVRVCRTAFGLCRAGPTKFGRSRWLDNSSMSRLAWTASSVGPVEGLTAARSSVGPGWPDSQFGRSGLAGQLAGYVRVGRTAVRLVRWPGSSSVRFAGQQFARSRFAWTKIFGRSQVAGQPVWVGPLAGQQFGRSWAGRTAVRYVRWPDKAVRVGPQAGQPAGSSVGSAGRTAVGLCPLAGQQLGLGPAGRTASSGRVLLAGQPARQPVRARSRWPDSSSGRSAGRTAVRLGPVCRTAVRLCPVGRTAVRVGPVGRTAVRAMSGWPDSSSGRSGRAGQQFAVGPLAGQQFG